MDKPVQPINVVRLAHSLAYDFCVSQFNGDCVTEREGDEQWFDIGAEGEGPEHDAVDYLEVRGLLIHHPTRERLVQIRDESEATA